MTTKTIILILCSVLLVGLVGWWSRGEVTENNAAPIPTESSPSAEVNNAPQTDLPPETPSSDPDVLELDTLLKGISPDDFVPSLLTEENLESEDRP